MYLYGDKTIKVDRDSAEVLPRESLALVVSTCGENPFVWYRLLGVRRRGVVFGTIYRRLDGSDSVQVRSWTSAGELSSGTSSSVKISS